MRNLRSNFNSFSLEYLSTQEIIRTYYSHHDSLKSHTFNSIKQKKAIKLKLMQLHIYIGMGAKLEPSQLTDKTYGT